MSFSSSAPSLLLPACLVLFLPIMKTPTDNAVPTAEATQPKPKTQPIDLHRLIRCLEEVEGGQWNWPGGKLRVSRAFWHDHSLPIYNYRQATDPAVAHEVVARGLTHYVAELTRLGHEPTVQMLARCYNMGWNGAMHDPKAKSEYAERVNNLYTDKDFNP